MSYEQELAVAREGALAAGEIALELWGKAPARRKADDTWVTEADEAVEAELRRRLAAAFPEYDVLGEEGLEAALAGAGESDERVIEELADVWFASYVLLASRGLDPAAVERELERRAR